MKIAEIRDLDGPNLFMLRPAIKLELDTGGESPAAADAFATDFAHEKSPGDSTLVPVTLQRLTTLLTGVVYDLHDRLGLDRPEVVTRPMETPNHYAIAFSWDRRALAMALAQTAFDVVSGAISNLDSRMSELTALAENPVTSDDAPAMLRDDERRIPIIGITGTNGKTTTTRLVASILIGAGKRVGWTSSSGVIVQGNPVMEGYYTGPAGAARVFEEPDLDIAVLETARGGILLRGLGYESNDVSVVTNVTADHLGLQGVYSVEELARVKQVVAAVTTADGFVVLNAGDPLVMGMRRAIRGRPFLISREPGQPEVVAHYASGGWALWVNGDAVHFGHDGCEEVLADLHDIPITFKGKAEHMLENALCAAAATLAIGLDIDDVRRGLIEFRNKPDQNRGRLNVFELNGTTVIVDFAHNAAGLKHLLKLGRALTADGCALIAAIGTAGDRPDEAIIELGRLGGEQADIVIAKDTEKYLRGRSSGAIVDLILTGAGLANHEDVRVVPNEHVAFDLALELAQPGDTVAIMCIENLDQILDYLTANGTAIS
ncbi:hypothetical protein BH24CHL3_BH24CHL3_09820 [soil metagenome]